MITIPTPAAAWASHKVSLSSNTYQFDFRFSDYQQRWVLDIYLNDTPVILGEKIIEGSPLFYGKPIKYFDHGLLVPYKNWETNTPIGRNNLGIGKEYSLYYFTFDEYQQILATEL